MVAREWRSLAVRAGNELCVVMLCDDLAEAERVGQTLWHLNTGVLVTYQRLESIPTCQPAGPVAAIFLDIREAPPRVGRLLKWLRGRWPHCPITVVGDAGGGEMELTARTGGASYLTRPVSRSQWLSVLSHVLARPPRIEQPTEPRDVPGGYRPSGTRAR